MTELQEAFRDIIHGILKQRGLSNIGISSREYAVIDAIPELLETMIDQALW
jgi:hypothetical protein